MRRRAFVLLLLIVITHWIDSNVISEWNKGYGIVNMLGHASERSITRFIWDHDDGDNIPEINEGELSYRDFLRRSDGDRVSLEKPPIVFTSGCSQLHSSNNMGRSFIEGGGATAFIGTTGVIVNLSAINIHGELLMSRVQVIYRCT